MAQHYRMRPTLCALSSLVILRIYGRSPMGPSQRSNSVPLCIQTHTRKHTRTHAYVMVVHPHGRTHAPGGARECASDARQCDRHCVRARSSRCGGCAPTHRSASHMDNDKSTRRCVVLATLDQIVVAGVCALGCVCLPGIRVLRG